MSRVAMVLLLTSLVIVITGCPREREFHFTNASVSSDGRYTDTAGDGAGAPELDDNTVEEPREVVEPDVFKVDGGILYVLNQHRGLTLVDLDTEEILCRVPTYGMPRDLYIEGERAYVLVSNFVEYTAEGTTVSYTVGSCLYVVDIEDPAAAEVVSRFDFEGDLIDSRLVGDILYAVCVERPWYWYGWWWGVAEDGGVVFKEDATDPDTGTSTEPGDPLEYVERSWVTSINIAVPSTIYQVDEVSFEGLGNIIHCTDRALFVAAPDYTGENPETLITYVDIDDAGGDMTVRGDIGVKGYVGDRYKMDAYDGVLRVVAALGQWWGNSGVAVTTVDLSDPDNLAILASVELEGAINESLFATRFDGPRAYVVTYFRVDPLFVLDLSDPAAPELLGQLVVPGWSTHIEPRGDRLIALGVDDSEGKQRVCVSLYDVSGPESRPATEDPWAPILVDRVTFGEDWTWSNANSEVKAFNVMDGLILVPFSGYDGAGWYNRLQFVGYTEADLEAQGYCDQRGNILRSFPYATLYYCITDRELAAIDAADPYQPAVVSRLVLSENVFDYFEAGAGGAVEIITDWEDPIATVRLHAAAKDAGALRVDVGNLIAAMPYGQDAVLVGANYGESYKVAVVDCSSESAPSLIRQFEVGVWPFWNYYYDYPVYLDDDVRPMKDAAIGLWWYPQAGQTAYILGNKLVLKCWAEEYDVELGSDESYGLGLAIANLDDSTYTTVGLNFANVVSLEGVGDSMYIGTWVDASGIFDFGQPECANYLQSLNVNTLEMGPAVNVPGSYIDYDPARDLLFVRDDQWDSSGNIASAIRTVRWDGGEDLESLDTLALNASTWNLMRRGGSIFGTVYDNGTVLFTATVDGDGDFDSGPKAVVTKDWASILGAREGVAYMTVNSAVLRYDLTEGELALTSMNPTMGYPTSIRFGADYDYVCLGYSGVLTLPR